MRHVLSAIAVPTLVLQNAEDNWVPVESGRELAELIPGVDLSSRCRSAATSPRSPTWTAFLEPIEPFLATSWEADAEPEPDRVLATVLFTDIVGSTAHMAEAR